MKGTLVVVQARMGSSRLPGKILRPLAGRPVLERQIERIRAARTPFELVVAVPYGEREEPIRSLCRSIDVRCIDGHETDLLERHLRAAEGTDAEWIVKIPSDCPLIDPGVIDRVLAARGDDVDFVTNLHPPTWPDGNDVEAMRRSVLETAHREATRAFEREHTTPFVWERPRRFRIRNVRAEDGRDRAATHRFTLDYEEDYLLIAAIYDALFREESPVFSLSEIDALLEARPELLALNARHTGRSWHDAHSGELVTMSKRDGHLIVNEPS